MKSDAPMQRRLWLALGEIPGHGRQERASLARDQRLTFSRERVPRFVRSRGATNTPIGKTFNLKSLWVTPKDFFLGKMDRS